MNIAGAGTELVLDGHLLPGVGRPAGVVEGGDSELTAKVGAPMTCAERPNLLVRVGISVVAAVIGHGRVRTK